MQKIVAIDSQRLNEMQSCWRKYKFYHLEHERPVITPGYFEEGTLLHKMLKTYYSCKKYRVNWQASGKTHADVVDSCVKVGRYFAIEMSLDAEEVEETIHALREYCTHFANDGWDRILFVEQPACKVLHEDSELVILYEGVIDLVIAIPNCPLLPIDHKKARKRQEPEKLSNQFIGYCWLLGVRNIVINKVGLQKTLKPEEKFQRYTLSYTDEIIKEWREETIWWVRESLAMAEKDYYPGNKTSCDKYAGCIFREVCESDPACREWKLRSLFDRAKEPWDAAGSLL